MSRVEIFTDGACSGNPGPGGWGAILRYGKAERELSGGESPTTNNRMEILAVITALETLKRPCAVIVYSDSRYVCDGVASWLANWKRKGWKTATGKAVSNDDLWRRLDALLDYHEVECRWVRGHAGHAENERCDALARAAIATHRASA